MKKHFVIFRSVEEFLKEDTIQEIDSWDIIKAKKMAKHITAIERLFSAPYAFYFITRESKGSELDGKIINESNTYYLHGKVKTLEELKSENKWDNTSLILNMESNKWNKIIIIMKPYLCQLPFGEKDILLT